MKKLFALLLALSMLLTLAACGGGEQTANLDDAPETSATTDTTGETQESTDSTEGTTEATTPETTTPPTTEPDETKPTDTTPPETQPTHKHNYSSKVTKAATCTAKGTKTYTCSCGKFYTEDIKATGHSYSAKTTKEPTCTAEGVKTFSCKCGSTYTEPLKAKGHSHTVTDSKKATCTEDGFTKYSCACGDTYTETQTAAGHSMGGWKVYSYGSLYTVGENRNSCANCSHYESKMQYDAFFEKYMDTAHRLHEFSSVDELTISEYDGRVIQAIIDNVAWVDLGRNQDGYICIGFKIDDVNAYTTNRLGRTYDYTDMGTIQTTAGKCTYDAESNMLVEVRYEGDGYDKAYIGYTTADDIHFVVKYNIDGEIYTSNIELIGGKYIITSQTVTWG